MRKRRKTVMVTMTHDCNLSCRYCYEANKSKKSIALQVAQEVISRHFHASDSFDEIEITLHGGEPFTVFDKIRELCNWIWSQSWPKPYIVFITTNGTLVHGVIQEWAAAEKKRLYLALSLDGTPAMHDANRSNSFTKIDHAFFLRNWPDQPVKMTLSEISLPSLAEGIVFVHRLGFKIQCNFAYGADWARSENLGILATQLGILTQFYLDNPEIEPCDFMNMNLSVVGASTDEGKQMRGMKDADPRKWCGIGTDLWAIDIDGQEYPCHLFLPMAAGEKSDTFKQHDFCDCDSLRDPRCNECVILPICPTCYAMNVLESENPATRNTSLCALNKLRARAVSNLQANMLLRRVEFPAINKLSDEEVVFTILGIESIQSAMQLAMPSRNASDDIADFMA